MEDCNICYQSKDSFFEASKCGHSLCIDCFRLLNKNECPFCRQSYTHAEIIIKGYNNSQTIYNYNPPQYNINLPNINIRLDIYNTEETEQVIHIPFSRIRRNMIRKKRRNLTFDEVKERRRKIRKKMRMKWNRKNNRLKKIVF